VYLDLPGVYTGVYLDLPGVYTTYPPWVYPTSLVYIPPYHPGYTPHIHCSVLYMRLATMLHSVQ